VAGLIRRRDEPAVVQTARSTVAAVLAYLVAQGLDVNPAPLLAPLTALLVVQVTLYSTLTTGLRRVGSVVAGVIVAVAFSVLVGLSWWSLGLLILSSLILGQLLRVEEFVSEVAISGMLVLGVVHVTATALGRVVETLIGAAVGVLLNAVVVPPLYVEPAGAAIEELTRRMRRLLVHIGGGLSRSASHQQAIGWLHEARRLDQEIARVDAELTRAEESTRLNPRYRQGLQARLILRSGLDTLEICAVVLRTLCRSLTDLFQERPEDEPVYGYQVAAVLEDLLRCLADAVDGFGRLITAQVTAGAEQAQTDLEQALLRGRKDRERIAELLLSEAARQPQRWELHGALLANADRLLNELDVDKRAQWLEQELSRQVKAPLTADALLSRLLGGRPGRRRRRLFRR
jgi:uncharacterized membrane protein YgaE (UPF0421/DUF939 family)